MFSKCDGRRSLAIANGRAYTEHPHVVKLIGDAPAVADVLEVQTHSVYAACFRCVANSMQRDAVNSALDWSGYAGDRNMKLLK